MSGSSKSGKYTFRLIFLDDFFNPIKHQLATAIFDLEKRPNQDGLGSFC